MTQIAGRDVRRVKVIDDDKDFRKTLAETVQDAGFIPIDEAGPLGTLRSFVRDTVGSTQAALCDHHLRQRARYSSFNGAEAVAELYRQKFPAVLCTRWDQANIEEIRGFRQYVPVLLRPSEVDPDAVTRGIGYCIDEFNGIFRQNRKASRALVRVEDSDSELIYVIVPAFAPDEIIRLRKEDIPSPIIAVLKSKKKNRFHARVNLGAETSDQLFFKSWEPG